VRVACSLVALALVAGCGTSLGRDAYTRANEQIFGQLPRFPSAQLTRTSSAPYYGENDRSPVKGYTTVYEFKFAAQVSGASVASFFTRRLAPDWLLVETVAAGDRGGPVLNFRHAKALVSINLESAPAHRFEVDVDHAFFGKLGRCGIPGGCGGSAAWVALRQAVLACHAKEVSQTHSREVVMTLKNGRIIAATEARIDAIGDVLNAAHCEPPPIYVTE
jgi:hypothetical protein